MQARPPPKNVILHNVATSLYILEIDLVHLHSRIHTREPLLRYLVGNTSHPSLWLPYTSVFAPNGRVTIHRAQTQNNISVILKVELVYICYAIGSLDRGSQGKDDIFAGAAT